MSYRCALAKCIPENRNDEETREIFRQVYREHDKLLIDMNDPRLYGHGYIDILRQIGELLYSKP